MAKIVSQVRAFAAERKALGRAYSRNYGKGN